MENRAGGEKIEDGRNGVVIEAGSGEYSLKVLIREGKPTMFKNISAIILLMASSAFAAGTKVTIDPSGNLVVDGKTLFPISVAVLPPPDAKTPTGKSAWQEFSDSGVNFARVVPGEGGEHYGWNAKGFQVVNAYMDALASAHMYAWLWLGEDISYMRNNDKAKEEKLRKIIDTYKDNPALGCWKGADEPQWGNMNTHGKRPPSSIAQPYKMIHELDPNHPVVIIQAPRGTVQDNAAYDPYLDITGMDIFPIGYPPGMHVPTWPNKTISMVGDWTKIIVEAAHGKPVWMTLQVTWSGVARPGRNTLRYPTFAQERFMTYEAIIDGARGVNYFGGSNLTTLNERDKKLGYNWTFWDRILRPLLTEINAKSPLGEALIAPDSKLPFKASDAQGVEFTVRQVGDEIYILACKRQGDTEQVTFSGLPASVSSGDVLYEEPRTVKAKDGAFTDWFAPFDVHVYRFGR
jgi:hypothetical protein